MKKIFKKFLVSLSVCCLAIVCSLFVLAGCSNEDGENTTKVIPPDIAFTVAEKCWEQYNENIATSLEL